MQLAKSSGARTSCHCSQPQAFNVSPSASLLFTEEVLAHTGCLSNRDARYKGAREVNGPSLLPSKALELALHDQKVSQLVPLGATLVKQAADRVALVLGAREQPRTVVEGVFYCAQQEADDETRQKEGPFLSEPMFSQKWTQCPHETRFFQTRVCTKPPVS